MTALAMAEKRLRDVEYKLAQCRQDETFAKRKLAEQQEKSRHHGRD